MKKVQSFDELAGWSVTSISQLEQDIKIFKGPRLRTENILVDSKMSGANVVPYYTPSAILQERRDSVKWIDLAKASKRQLENFKIVTVYEGDILITRSGSIGRIAYISSSLNNSIVSDDAIRVRIKDPKIRAYVFAYLQSKLAQDQMTLNEYGAVQQHLEPSHIANLIIPIPDDWATVEETIKQVENYIKAKEDIACAQNGINLSLGHLNMY